MSYMTERRAFKHLQEQCPQAALDEYLLAVGTVLEQYNTTVYENRFVVGGAVEVFTYALLRASGLDCTLYADQEKSGDLLLPGGKRLSVKGSFAGGMQDIKLINQLGDGLRAWDTATLFVVSEVGIIYGDPDLVADKAHIKQVADGVTLKRQGLAALAEKSRQRYLIPMPIPRKASAQLAAHSLKASATVADRILQDHNLQTLQSALHPPTHHL